jgi:hypothetical protein
MHPPLVLLLVAITVPRLIFRKRSYRHSFLKVILRLPKPRRQNYANEFNNNWHTNQRRILRSPHSGFELHCYTPPWFVVGAVTRQLGPRMLDLEHPYLSPWSSAQLQLVRRNFVYSYYIGRCKAHEFARRFCDSCQTHNHTRVLLPGNIILVLNQLSRSTTTYCDFSNFVILVHSRFFWCQFVLFGMHS